MMKTVLEGITNVSDQPLLDSHSHGIENDFATLLAVICAVSFMMVMIVSIGFAFIAFIDKCKDRTKSKEDNEYQYEITKLNDIEEDEIEYDLESNVSECRSRETSPTSVTRIVGLRQRHSNSNNNTIFNKINIEEELTQITSLDPEEGMKDFELELLDVNCVVLIVTSLGILFNILTSFFSNQLFL